jgi:hypothetical protein
LLQHLLAWTFFLQSIKARKAIWEAMNQEKFNADLRLIQWRNEVFNASLKLIWWSMKPVMLEENWRDEAFEASLLPGFNASSAQLG